MSREADPAVTVSVVTPFYNTAAYLPACIESVLAQTYPHFDYLLVDNRSTDGSADIAADYARRDPRIRLVHNERFLTQVQNYNGALRRIAKGSRYCKIVQADDTLMPRCLEEMVAVADAHPRAAIISSYRFQGSSVNPEGGLPHDRTLLSGREACRLHLIDNIYLFGSPTTVMYRADVVRGRDPFYPERWLFEDAGAAFEILREHDLAFVHQILSFSRIDDRSLTGAVRHFRPCTLAKVIFFKRHGRHYLTPEEYERYAGAYEAWYRRFLAESWAFGREPAFWEFHEAGLASIGETIGPLPHLRHVVPAMAHALLGPRLIRALRRAKRALGGGR
jgi:glycosyltransferase involved in cell wall biosynthesis